MNANTINPFIEAVGNVFSTMVHIQPHRNHVRVVRGGDRSACLTSLVGLSGQVNGVVALRFPPLTALHVAGRLLGAAPVAISAEVIDALAELAHMVAGSAKARLQPDPPLTLGLPTVVDGAGYELRYPSQVERLQIAFTSEAGPFSLEVTVTPS